MRAAIVVVLILQVVVLQGLATGPAATSVGVRQAIGAATALPAARAISVVVVGTLAATIVVVLILQAVVVLPGLATDPAGVGV